MISNLWNAISPRWTPGSTVPAITAAGTEDTTVLWDGTMGVIGETATYTMRPIKFTRNHTRESLTKIMRQALEIPMDQPLSSIVTKEYGLIGFYSANTTLRTVEPNKWASSLFRTFIYGPIIVLRLDLPSSEAANRFKYTGVTCNDIQTILGLPAKPEPATPTAGPEPVAPEVAPAVPQAEPTAGPHVEVTPQAEPVQAPAPTAGPEAVPQAAPVPEPKATEPSPESPTEPPLPQLSPQLSEASIQNKEDTGNNDDIPLTTTCTDSNNKISRKNRRHNSTLPETLQPVRKSPRLLAQQRKEPPRYK
jgi:hypothetical protein